MSFACCYFSEERRSAFVRASTTSFDSYTHNERRSACSTTTSGDVCCQPKCALVRVCVMRGSRCSSQIFDHDVGFEPISKRPHHSRPPFLVLATVSNRASNFDCCMYVLSRFSLILVSCLALDDSLLPSRLFENKAFIRKVLFASLITSANDHRFVSILGLLKHCPAVVDKRDSRVARKQFAKMCVII